ncbi:Zinc metalloproteinase nas-15 [Holothuria leucospilota]|uniref:Metalloendopeptidase n=1 Tax=Holothuria leucospilota TaxID=206669 RepID=A0A9Q0YGA4_HOLLE|nr:Zinc metalloproteinase nas-15 [Holothuria leucospilota]
MKFLTSELSVCIAVWISLSSAKPLTRGTDKANLDEVNGPVDVQLIEEIPSFEMNLKTPTAYELRTFGTDQEEGSMEYILRENEDIQSGVEHYLIEGDIKVDYNVSQVSPNAVRNRNVRWPGGVVPYFIDRSFDSGARQRILAAIERYHQTTCIRFVPWNGQRDYVHIVPRQGCFSAVGRRGGRQELSVGGACNFHRGTIMHELMHAVGFQHEQTRTDRDQFVTVYYQNIQPGLEYNFIRYNQDTIDHLQTRYDYYSIMHYPMYAFSRNGRPTIAPRQSGVSIGNRNDFSTTDILKINRYYECEDTTDNGGEETNPDDCEETHPNCSFWAQRGECSRNPAWMLTNCPVSCRQCRPSTPGCSDDNDFCSQWARNGECQRNPRYMLTSCRQSCNVC